jgi:hypothetical protein
LGEWPLPEALSGSPLPIFGLLVGAMFIFGVYWERGKSKITSGLAYFVGLVWVLVIGLFITNILRMFGPYSSYRLQLPDWLIGTIIIVSGVLVFIAFLVWAFFLGRITRRRFRHIRRIDERWSYVIVVLLPAFYLLVILCLIPGRKQPPREQQEDKNTIAENDEGGLAHSGR